MRLGSALTSAEPIPDTVIAADTYYAGGLNTTWWQPTVTNVSRSEAMSVPAIARARDLLCGLVGTLPIERYSSMTGKHLQTVPLFYQPDPASPRSVTYSWLADSIFFYGVGYVQVLETYATDNRPARFRWIDPLRVQPVLNDNDTMVVAYQLDGAVMPTDGVGSILAFPGIDEGILKRGAQTIKTAVALEAAAKRAAEEPVPTTVLQSTGLDLPPERVVDLLTSWKQARQTRSTAYLYSGIKMDAVGFDPKSQQLVEARSYIAQEIARLCNIPAWYINAETASMTYSNTVQERRSLIDFSLLPYLLRPIEDRLGMQDISPRAITVRFDLEEFLRGSALERLEITKTLLELGLITIDEAKAREDLSPEGTTD